MTDPTPLEHNLQAPVLPDASAPWWEDGYTISSAHAEPGFLAKGINAFWQRVKGWLLLPLAQQDPLTCSLSLLNLLAWERDIARFESEPLALFHKRWQQLDVADPGLAQLVQWMDQAAQDALRSEGLDEVDFVPYQSVWPRLRDGYLHWLLGEHAATQARFDAAEQWRARGVRGPAGRYAGRSGAACAAGGGYSGRAAAGLSGPGGPPASAARR